MITTIIFVFWQYLNIPNGLRSSTIEFRHFQLRIYYVDLVIYSNISMNLFMNKILLKMIIDFSRLTLSSTFSLRLFTINEMDVKYYTKLPSYPEGKSSE